MDHHHSPLFPEGACVLQLQHGTVTRDKKQECAGAQTLPVLQTKIMQADPIIFDQVDWTAYGRALTAPHSPTNIDKTHS